MLANADIRPPFARFDVLFHRGVIFFEYAYIPVSKVQRAGHEHARVAPESYRFFGHSGGEAVALNGYAVGNAAVPRLFAPQILEPFIEKPRHTEVITRRLREYRYVARPAHSLVALGAVGGNIHEVGFSAPTDIFLQSVDKRVGTDETSVVLYFRIERDRLDLDILFVHTAYARVAVTHIGHTGHKFLNAVAAGIFYKALRRTQKYRIELAVLGEHLGVADFYFLPRLAVYSETDNARKVLTEIVNYFPALRFGCRNGLENFVRAHGRAVRRDYPRFDFNIFYRSAAPDRFALVHSGVVNLAVVKLRKAHAGITRNQPVPARAEHFGSAVRVVEADFRKQSLTGRRDAVLAGEHEGAYRPAARNATS